MMKGFGWQWFVGGFSVLVLLLTGCTQQKDFRYYRLHPEAIQATLERCKTMGGEAALKDGQCMAALNAAQEIREQLQFVAMHQEQFGQQIIAAQIKLAELKEQLKTASDKEDQENIKKQIKDQTFDIEGKLAVLRLLSELAGMNNQ